MVKIGDTVHYVSRGSADGKYPPVHVPMIVTNVHQMGRIGKDGVVPIVDGWTFNSHGTRFEENVMPSMPKKADSTDANIQGGEWHPRENCEWNGWPEIPGLKELMAQQESEESV